MKYWEKLNEIVECEEGIAMASKIVLEISRDEVERARLMSEYKYVVDTQSKVVQARREGRRQGIQEGIQKKAIEFAQKLKSRGVAAEQIAEDTGLSLQQIEDL
jgi:predicted transposase/invertase (TIGR01784 family)